MTEEEKQQHIFMFNSNLNLFNSAFMEHKMTNDPAPFHPEMNEELANDSHLQTSFVCFRGSAKSTLGTVNHTVWRICRHSGETPLFIIIISQTQNVASAFLQSIKWEIQFNPKIKYYYGELYDPNRTWSKTRIETKNNVCVQAAGSLQQIRGFQFMNQRPQLIILDDIESESNSDTADARAKLAQWIEGAVIPSLDPNWSRIIMIGTIIHNDTYLKRTISNPDWHTLNYPIVDENGDPLWPDRFTPAIVERIRIKYSRAGMEHIFHREYMNNPVDPSMQPFSERNIKYHNAHYLKLGKRQFIIHDGVYHTCKIYIGVDPAISLKGDFSTIVVSAAASNGIVYVLDYVREHIRPSELIERIFEKYDMYESEIIRIEAIAFQEVLMDTMYQEMRKRNKHFGIEPVKSMRNKEARILSIQPKFNSHSVYIREGMDELKRELVEFPRGATDDLLDGLYFSMMDMNHPESVEYESYKRKQENPIKERPYSTQQGINWLTGVPYGVNL